MERVGKMKKHEGKTRLETILIMLMLVVFGISTYTLVAAAASSYGKTRDDMGAKDNIRLAVSYIDSRIRQSNLKNVFVIKDAIDGKDVISIEEDIDGKTYKNIIYFKDGYLKEMLIQDGTDFGDVEGFDIAKIDDMSIEESSYGLINVSVSTSNGHGRTYTSNTMINLKKD